MPWPLSLNSSPQTCPTSNPSPIFLNIDSNLHPMDNKATHQEAEVVDIEVVAEEDVFSPTRTSPLADLWKNWALVAVLLPPQQSILHGFHPHRPSQPSHVSRPSCPSTHYICCNISINFDASWYFDKVAPQTT
ncbi:hypothetical protein Syun_024007 [Stephania yunnanensis]|uniref:Uncharacterized protein n=1 Tax=Stephania yunnanensis TaxID=152371 RepID=A0AAP0FAW6_9MAGN